MYVSIEINFDQYLEFEKIALGVFSPLNGFMDESDFFDCVHKLRLSNGNFFALPVVFDISHETYAEVRGQNIIHLTYNGTLVGSVKPSSYFSPDKSKVALKLFGTQDNAHPGVKYFYGLNPIFMGGKVELVNRIKFSLSKYEATPAEVREYFYSRGCNSIVGFQTRNVPHRAHEYLQRIALEIADGLLIQPIIGAKKVGDFKPEAVIRGYEALISNYYPAKRVMLSTLSTLMRYAGPREALFHAQIRKNYGCTHFIVGRDHAGVGNFYDKYAAHNLVDMYQEELGIKILKLNGPFFCIACDAIATSKSCGHSELDPDKILDISGTYIRDRLKSGEDIDVRFIRPEVRKTLSDGDLFL